MEEVAKVTMSEQDEEMECTFTVYEIDLDYEFDAARFFDFTRLESPLEARQAEVWFHSAGSYPPSPFVANFVPRDEMLMENLCTSPKSKGVENMNPAECVSDVEDEEVISVVDTNNRDFDGKAYGTFNSLQIGSRTKLQNSSKNLPSGYTKSKPYTKLLTKKPSFPRTSTLLKPTASQLAKQNHPPQTGYASARSNTSVEKMDKSSVCTFGIENHAAKRQKLEGGLLRKVVDAEQPQQISFVHKVPKQDGITNHTKTRITIPREPDLETSHRSLKTRPKTSKESENGTSTVRRFKALPLNRKILEAPSLLPKRSIPVMPNFQEFHLKTSERAMLHKSVAPKLSVPGHQSYKASHKYSTDITTDQGNREPERPIHVNASRPEVCESSCGFKAVPLNMKILTSKGTFGVFRNSKKDTTVPMEFNFQTEKRFNHNPPIELFNKLSLAPETQQTANHESKLPRSNSTSAKGSKENRWGCFQKGNEIKQPSKARLPVLVGKQHIGVEAEKIEVYAASCLNWSNSVR
ncbi:protein TPX2-like isoform X1 [Primulina eburnea]|uniref:protein TPX2-like isoform X1 n=2 Tax=Primulina eburnea TaxID=1245227 RepID=UPI003C6C0502